ncbi:hypothetical protein WN48_06478 [Eufriesea mexicana]|uniref:Uncharacterized protein n=1 Tax=Eufriesea mexicana TaxID=516756 RepID=A0A310SPH0_9HYME|nr:hypothetical protein WN48_06478 [Eufriesea mexicana]
MYTRLAKSNRPIQFHYPRFNTGKAPETRAIGKQRATYLLVTPEMKVKSASAPNPSSTQWRGRREKKRETRRDEEDRARTGGISRQRRENICRMNNSTRKGGRELSIAAFDCQSPVLIIDPQSSIACTIDDDRSTINLQQRHANSCRLVILALRKHVTNFNKTIPGLDGIGASCGRTGKSHESVDDNGGVGKTAAAPEVSSSVAAPRRMGQGKFCKSSTVPRVQLPRIAAR